MGKDEELMVVENVNVPGYTTRVNKTMYQAMLLAMQKAVPSQAPGLTQAEVIEAVKTYLPDELFPGDQKVGWWMKSVQLDQEAKGNLVREPSKPLRWHWVKQPE